MTRHAASLLIALFATLVAPAHAAWGEVDCLFGSGGYSTPAFTGLGGPYDATVDGSGNILVRVGFPSTVGVLYRVTPIGTVAGTINIPTATSGGFDPADVVLGSGLILSLAGWSSPNSTEAFVLRSLPTGALDPTFGNAGRATVAGLTGATAGPVVMVDGSIVIGGNVGGANLSTAGTPALARFNASGIPDASFGVGGLATNPNAGGNLYRSIALQSDGKILAVTSTALARHLANGQVDTSFGTGGKVTFPAGLTGELVRVQPTGAILVALRQEFPSINLTLKRYTAAGFNDVTRLVSYPGAAPGVGLASPLPFKEMHMMADGRVVIAGDFAAVGYALVRYSADLTDEASALLASNPRMSYVLPDGKVIVGSGFTSQIIRLLGDNDLSTCAPTTTVLGVNPGSSVFRQAVTLTATVSATLGPTPTGSVQFSRGPNVGAPVALVNGVATLTTTALPAGSLSLTAKYLPTGGFSSSTSAPVSHVVTPTVTPVDSVGNSATGGTMSFMIRLEGNAISVPVTVDYATSDATAQAGIDYTATSGSVTFPAGTTIAFVTVPVLQKSAPAAQKEFFLTLGNPTNAALDAISTALGKIAYFGQGAQSVYIDDAQVIEGNSGVTLLGFTVSLANRATTPITVTYATADDTAIAGTDYTARSGTLTFGNNQSQQWVIVAVHANTTVQANRRFVVNITGASQGTIAKGQAVGTILDDDPATAAPNVPMYRLYSDITKEHLYTTDSNEYAVLATRAWVQEGVEYNLFSNAGTFGARYAIPLYRVYHPGIQQHHWTTDSNEVMVLVGTGAWQYEGIPGYVLPAASPGSTPLYRLNYISPPLHLWTTDLNEKNVLTTQFGWIYEGVVGEVLP